MLVISLQIEKWITKTTTSVCGAFRRKCSSGFRKGLTLLKGARTYSKFEMLLQYADFFIFSLLIVPEFEFRKRRKS